MLFLLLKPEMEVLDNGAQEVRVKEMKRLMVAVVILAVIVVMTLRGCPRVRRSAGIGHEPATAVVTGITRTARAKHELTRYPFISER